MEMNHFKSTRQKDQKVLSHHTLPASVQDIYESCDNLPTINTYEIYRDDEKERLKFYTDPDYIYHLWIEDQNKQIVSWYLVDVFISHVICRGWDH